MRRSTLVVGLLTAGIGFGLFQLKYEVMNLEKTHKRLNNEIRLGEESVSILKAEWAHLTNPATLQKMARKHLEADTVMPKQLVSFKRFSARSRSHDVHMISSTRSVQKTPDTELEMILDEAIKEISYSSSRRGKR